MLVGYARVSTQSQVHDLQLDAMRAAGVDRVFIEVASGAKVDRPELAAALEYCRPGDTLVTWRLDRLARSMPQLVHTIEDLNAKGVGFRSLTEGIDTGSINGRLIFNIFSALAVFERELTRERSRAGLESARARGRIGGRPKGLKPADITMAKAMLKDPNITVVQTAQRLGVGVATLYRHLGPGGRSTL